MQNDESSQPNFENAKSEVQRKTLDQRAQMDDLMRLRHSCAHIMATAVLRLWPDALLDIGPPTEEGFYYDFDLSHRFSPDDFAKIEETMRQVVKENQVFEKSIKTRDEARAFFEAKGQKFKLERLGDIPEGEAISFYQNGEFVDLCAGPHVMRTGNVKPGGFKLLKVASAYFRGNEKNPQLQRLYGTAFKNKEELENWVKLQEEAKRRDHRKIGAEMGLFAFDAEYVGPGLALWLPKGAVLVEELEKLAKETEFQAGYVRVKTPHLAKEKMYKTSGHLPYYAESMFPAMELPLEPEQKTKAERDLAVAQAKYDKLEKQVKATDEFKAEAEKPVRIQFDSQNQTATIERNLEFPISEQLAADLIESEELLAKAENRLKGDRYYLKAMNCPHHHRIFAAEPRSYRDLPLRLAEYGTCYRYEQSGELFGLMRVRALNMNDAHIYCTADQFAAEFNAVNEMYLKHFKVFGLDRYQMRFSTHDPARLGDKFVNEPELWKQTEDMVRRVLIESGINYVEVPNEAAFYGPKIDVQVWSTIGREFTIATNQVDFAVPARFGLTYRDRDNTDKTPLCIHRAPLGTHERFIGFLIEHYAGNFPLWLAPEQVRVLTIGDDQPIVDYAKSIVQELRSQFVRIEADLSTNPIKAKIAEAEKAKVHTMLVIGGRDLEAGNISVRLHSKGPQGAKAKAEVVADILAAIKERRA
ncbi:MAG TPA: threonine--tRNA ligase [Verrucomicrobiota bacterium]|nr:threonine--tRNA ligase [Verrucomicrobiales bacterium]HRI11851.1 threonine--tRNA ligase [Verrucomicrobiota bacterium]